MLVALWNSPSQNTAFHSPVRIGLRGTWPNVVPAFNVDGKDVSSVVAANRFKLLPVMDWVIDAGIPPDWSQDNIRIIRDTVSKVYKALGGWWGLSKAYRATIRHVTDFENYTQAIDRTSPRLAEVTGMPFCGTFAHVMGQALRAAGFTGPAANYAMCHGPDCPPLGGLPFNRATPFHCPAAMDGRTTFLVGYVTADGPEGCLSYVEVLKAMGDAEYGFWLAVSADYQPGLEYIIEAAQGLGCSMLLLWADESRRRSDPHFAAGNDAKVARYLASAGWGGNT